MIKVIAIGDIHGRWPYMWRALRSAIIADQDFEPTDPVLEGRIQVVFMGDLVHFKDERAYADVVGVEDYDVTNTDHLKRAAKAQIRELYRFKEFVDKCNGNLQIILGNHDESAVDHEYELSSRGGLRHDEFNEEKGGIPLPDDLKEWFLSFPREIRFHGVQFAHAGPTPSMQYFDDFFYHDKDTKTWWYDKPDLVDQVGHRFGVYGHTVMKQGIYIDKDNRFAMIDAMDHKQYLEIFLDDERLDYRVSQFT